MREYVIFVFLVYLISLTMMIISCVNFLENGMISLFFVVE